MTRTLAGSASGKVPLVVTGGRDGRRRLRALGSPTTSGGRFERGRPFLRRWTLIADQHPRLAAVLIAATTATVAGIAAGPTAAAIATAYVVATVAIVAARRRAREDAKVFDAAITAVGAVAADLRAGADPTVAVARSRSSLATSGSAGDVSRRLDAAIHVADESGAPLADVLDRLETDARTLARSRASATSQAAGAQATAVLLAALPVAGIALGEGVGADPVHVLLHTPLGAACAGGAMGFQLAGLAWAQRLANSIREAA